MLRIWGLSRLLAAAIEQYHDDKGIIWPLRLRLIKFISVLFIGTARRSGRPPKKSVDELEGAELEVLFDDRQESPV